MKSHPYYQLFTGLNGLLCNKESSLLSAVYWAERPAATWWFSPTDYIEFMPLQELLYYTVSSDCQLFPGLNGRLCNKMSSFLSAVYWAERPAMY
jgi:hypothetical protein